MLALAPASTSSTSPSLIELLTLSLLQQQQSHLAGQTYHAPPQPLPPPPSLRSHSVLSAPPSPTKLQHRMITLDEFCEHYSISPADRERLEKLEYCPGNAINKLEREDWQGQAGFSKLLWNWMLETHHTFLNDVQQGFWA
jgi:hypothetical protein